MMIISTLDKEYNMEIVTKPKAYKGFTKSINVLMEGRCGGEHVFRSARQVTGYFVPFYYEQEFDLWHGYQYRFGYAKELIAYTTRDGANPIWWLVDDIKANPLAYGDKTARRLRYVEYALGANISVGSVDAQRKRYLATKNTPPPTKSRYLLNDAGDEDAFLVVGS
jgi:hypothetical protein